MNICRFRSISSVNIASRSLQSSSVLKPSVWTKCDDKICGITKVANQSFYPTHQLIVRNFGTSNAIRRPDDNDSEEPSKPRSVIKDNCPYFTTLFFSIKLSYYILFFDKDIKWHLGPSFAEGIKMAFIYVTDCLADKNYKALENVVTPELYETLVEREGDKDYEVVTKLKHIMMTDIDWQLNTFTKEKDLKVTAQVFYSVSESEVLSLKDYRFAYFSLHRRYGDNMKDTNWTVCGWRFKAFPRKK